MMAAEPGKMQSAIDLEPGKRYRGRATGTLGAPGWPGRRTLIAKWFKDVKEIEGNPYADSTQFEGTFRDGSGKVSAKVLYDEGIIEIVPTSGGGLFGGKVDLGTLLTIAVFIYSITRKR